MGTGKSEQHPYWHGQEIIYQALALNKLAAAATAFHRSISLMPIAIAEAEADYGSIPEDIRSDHALLMADHEEDIPQQDLYPFTGNDSFAFAAARRDHGSLRILDSFCGSFSEEPEPCSADYLRIVQTIQDIVADNEVTDIKDIRRGFSQVDRVRLRSVWRAMRDAKILVVESQGHKVFFHRAAPETASSGPKPISFRNGMLPTRPVLLEWPEHLRCRSMDNITGLGEFFDEWPMIAPAEVLVPKESRRTRKSVTISAANKTWIQSVTINKKADGSRFISTAVINMDGSLGSTLDLPEGRFRSNPQGDCVTSIDREAVVRIYTPDAEQVLALNLSATPEVRATMKTFNEEEQDDIKVNSAIRSVHASLADERLAVSVINKVFVYSFAGETIAAFALDDERTSQTFGVIRASSSKRDWAYFVQLAIDGQGLYIGAYSGLLLHMSFSGELLDSWALPSPPQFLRETVDGISGHSASSFFRASRGSGEVHCLFVDSFHTSQLVGGNVILDTRTASGFFDLDKFVGRSVQLLQPRTAVYVARDELVMETATTRNVFSDPPPNY